MSTKTKTIPTTAQRLADLRAERDQLTKRLAELEQAAINNAFLAEAGVPDARQRHAEVAAARSAAENRLRELATAIKSGELHAEREQREAIEAERASWAKKADELREKQVDAARRLDAALAEADEAWAAYVAASDERGVAVRRAGRQWSNAAWINSFLARLMFTKAPRLARLFHMNPEYRRSASSAEAMVQP
jgi:chromosome segregation ATPase